MLLDKKELDENELDKSELRRKCTKRNVTEPFRPYLVNHNLDRFYNISRQFLRCKNNNPHFGIPNTIVFIINFLNWDATKSVLSYLMPRRRRRYRSRRLIPILHGDQNISKILLDTKKI